MNLKAHCDVVSMFKQMETKFKRGRNGKKCNPTPWIKKKLFTPDWIAEGSRKFKEIVNRREK